MFLARWQSCIECHCLYAVICRCDNRTSIIKVNFADDSEKPLTADVVMDHDWAAIGRPTSVCLKSVASLLRHKKVPMFGEKLRAEKLKYLYIYFVIL